LHPASQQPIASSDFDANSFNPQRPLESLLHYLTIALLFVGLCALLIYAPYIDETLNSL